MNTREKHDFGLLWLFALVLFLTMLTHTILVGVFLYVMEKNTAFSITGITPADIIRLTCVLAGFSIPVGLIIAAVVSKFPLKPVRDLIEGMNQLSSGDFTTRVNVGSVMAKYPAYVDMTNCFNKMAEQLEHTEMLRGDFINNFSHEFKTPIVSIAGFARLLKREDLTQSQRQEYLTAIEEESLRLSAMATNVLSMTRVENQRILSDVTSFNLSEQIRACVLLMEHRWVEKELELNLEFEEYMIRGNEELLKQIWINLLDNAVKFAPRGHIVQIGIQEKRAALQVEITNTGSSIPAQKLPLVFNKFYQAEESHTAVGNGVGLAIVRRIAELHGGTAEAFSRDNTTTIRVTLPK